jgi:sugar O-acyltransferase (sialic acid O-acetyltransferase NeuD family)
MRPVLERAGARVVAVCDDTPDLPAPFPDLPLLRGWEGLTRWLEGQDRAGLGFLVTIGNPHGRVRLRLHDRLVEAGLAPASAVHETAWLSESARIGTGAQIHAGAIVETGVTIGRQCIVNTRASVDHECVLEDGVEIAPGATLCGLVHVGTSAWVCAGATVLPRIRIGADAVVGAGAVVVRDVPEGTTVWGVPARPMPARSGR